MQSADRLIGTIRSHRKSIAYLSSAIVLASAGTASAATVGPGAHGALPDAPLAGAPFAAGHRLPAQHDTLHAGVVAVVEHGLGSLAHPAALQVHGAARHGVIRHQGTGRARWVAHRHSLRRSARPALAGHRVLPAADRLMPVATAGPQNVMPITSAQYANAATIVHRAVAERMGTRSAVIAVATAMQESRLQNLSYGTGDSLGLFQQQWDMGWGSAQQIMNPWYSAGKFLGALHSYQVANPAWASQPLYQAAQGVQRSAFPFAYAQWERQAAQLTASVLRTR